MSIPQKIIHPGRNDLYNELHARPLPVIESCARISHIALLVDEQQQLDDFHHLQQLCRHYQVTPPDHAVSSFSAVLGDLELRWERHLEFIAYTFLRHGVNESPFTHSAWSLLPQAWVEGLCGQLVVALHLELTTDGTEHWSKEQLVECFQGQRTLRATLAQGAGTLVSAFRLHDDGFGRIVLQTEGLRASQQGRLVQRVLELETYRLKAMLSARMARDLAPVLSGMDRDLATLITQLTRAEHLSKERALLDELTQMAARVEQYRAQTNSRFAATRAYYGMVQQRLKELDEITSGNQFTLADFLSRRLTPAVNTCEAVGVRLEDVAKRIERAGDLIRTRVDLNLESQNRDLLDSMDRRSKLQLRLQETVEGLSIAAISYYAVNLLRLLFNAVPEYVPGFDANIATAVSIPLVVGAVWWVTRRIKKMIIGADRLSK